MAVFFFFNDTATTEIYTLSLHDALPISPARRSPRLRLRKPRHPDRRGPDESRQHPRPRRAGHVDRRRGDLRRDIRDRKSTRLNSSHGYISYAVFCLKKKKNYIHTTEYRN